MKAGPWRFRRPRTIYPTAILVVMIAGFIVLPQIFGGRVDSYAVYAILQTFADYGLVALAIGLGMIMAEYDLSAAAVFGLGALLAVKLGVDMVAVGVLIAVVAGALAGGLQGTIMARLRMSSVEVTLGGLLVIGGLTQIIAHEKTVGYANVAVGQRLDKQVLDIFSIRSLIVIGVVLVCAAVMHFTRLGPEVQAVGGDRRSSRIAGVPVSRTLIGVFALGGAVAALGGALNGLSVAAAAPDVGLNPLVFGTIAAILGGVTLSGGQGTPIGIAFGALSLATLQQTLAIISAPPYVTNLVTGGLLVVVTLATAPDIGRLPGVRQIRQRRAIRALGEDLAARDAKQETAPAAVQSSQMQTRLEG